jgi:hypothetical protein
MGLMNFITGGAAKVQVTIPTIGFPSMPIAIKIVVTAEDNFECKNVFVDVGGTETLQFRPQGAQEDATSSVSTFRQEFQVAPGFKLAKGESKELTAVITLPREAQPTYNGKHGKHAWAVQARLEAKGNDPDSGWKELRVGANF